MYESSILLDPGTVHANCSTTPVPKSGSDFPALTIVTGMFNLICLLWQTSRIHNTSGSSRLKTSLFVPSNYFSVLSPQSKISKHIVSVERRFLAREALSDRRGTRWYGILCHSVYKEQFFRLKRDLQGLY